MTTFPTARPDSTWEMASAGAGYQVGYDDPAHFSRAYKRMFGAPPMRDAERLRGTASGGAERVV